MLYWNIGQRIHTEILKEERAEYGKKIVSTLSRQLEEEFGKGWGAKHLRHCLRIAETFSDIEIVAALSQQLSWSHFKDIFLLMPALQRLNLSY